jgi:hypothetical protein
MLNEEIHAQYQTVDDLDAVTNSQGDGSSQNENEDEYGDEEGE